AMGFRRFIFRGVTKVRDEWDLPCAALNLRRAGARRRRGLARWPRAVNPRSVTAQHGSGAPSERLRGAARVGRSRTRVRRRRIEAETVPPLPCTAVSGRVLDLRLARRLEARPRLP